MGPCRRSTKLVCAPQSSAMNARRFMAISPESARLAHFAAQPSSPALVLPEPLEPIRCQGPRRHRDGAAGRSRWLLRTAMRQSSPSPAKHIGLDPNTGRDAVPRTVRPPTGKREHVGAVVIFTKQFDRFSGWRFTQIEVVHTLLSGYHYELNT
jgi:hypothetical protein